MGKALPSLFSVMYQFVRILSRANKSHALWPHKTSPAPKFLLPQLLKPHSAWPKLYLFAVLRVLLRNHGK